MFRNQIPQFPDFGRQGIPDAKNWLTNPVPDIYPIPDNKPQGWGLTFMISGGPSGRSSSTGWWAGLCNCWWWCDREKGVAGMVTTQILPFVDVKVLNLWANVETAVYNELRQ
jgi:CubicO group peptidase (beta-lactamase class C family)